MKLQDITVQTVLDLSEQRPELKADCLKVVAHSKNGATAPSTDPVYTKGRPSFALLKVKQALESTEIPKFHLTQGPDGVFRGSQVE